MRGERTSSSLDFGDFNAAKIVALWDIYGPSARK